MAANHLGVLLLPPLGWFPAAVAGMLKKRPAECAATTVAAAAVDAAAAAAAEPAAVAAGRSVWDLGRSGGSVFRVSFCFSWAYFTDVSTQHER